MTRKEAEQLVDWLRQEFDGVYSETDLLVWVKALRLFPLSAVQEAIAEIRLEAGKFDVRLPAVKQRLGLKAEIRSASCDRAMRGPSWIEQHRRMYPDASARYPDDREFAIRLWRGTWAKRGGFAAVGVEPPGRCAIGRCCAEMLIEAGVPRQEAERMAEAVFVAPAQFEMWMADALSLAQVA